MNLPWIDRLMLQRAMHRIRHGGLSALTTRAAFHLRSMACGRRELRRQRAFLAVDDVIDYADTVCNGYFKPIQIREEIRQLLLLVQRDRPRRILEIGTASGGTLLMFSRVVAPDARMISLDLPGGRFGGGYLAWRMPLYRMFALPQQRIDLIRGDSHDVASRRTVTELLAGEQLDFLWIDGDHTYEGVKQDYEMYAPLVRGGGLIAFHDIVPSVGCGVTQLWQEVVSRYGEHYEYIASPSQTWAGIGVVRVPDSPGYDRRFVVDRAGGSRDGPIPRALNHGANPPAGPPETPGE